MDEIGAADRVKNLGRAVTIKRNGDSLFPGRRFVVNRRVRTLDSFLSDVTHGIRAPFGAVRQLCTPAGGTRVDDLTQLQPDKTYVACGMERFKPGSYAHGDRLYRSHNQSFGKLSNSSGMFPAVPALKKQPRPLLPGRLRQITGPKIVTVYRNGDIHFRGIRLLLDRHTLTDFEQVLALITQKVSLRTGAVRRLCNLDGTDVFGIKELENGAVYVAVGTGDRFMKLPYGTTSVASLPKKTTRPPKLKVMRRIPRVKEPQVDEDGIRNDTSILSSLSTVKLPQLERKRRHRPNAANLGMKRRSVGGPAPRLSPRGGHVVAPPGDATLSIPPQKAITPSLSRRSRNHPDGHIPRKPMQKPALISGSRSELPTIESANDRHSQLAPVVTGGPSVFYSDGQPKPVVYSPGLAEAETYYTETAGAGVFNAANQDADPAEVVDDAADLVVDAPIPLHDTGEPDDIEDLDEEEPDEIGTYETEPVNLIPSSPRSASLRHRIPQVSAEARHTQPQSYSSQSPDRDTSTPASPLPQGKEELQRQQLQLKRQQLQIPARGTMRSADINQAAELLDSLSVTPAPRESPGELSFEEVTAVASAHPPTPDSHKAAAAAAAQETSVPGKHKPTHPNLSLQLPADDLLVASQSAPAIINMDGSPTPSGKLASNRSTRSGSNLAPQPPKSAAKSARGEQSSRLASNSRAALAKGDKSTQSGAHLAPKSPRSTANSARSQQSSRLASNSRATLAKGDTSIQSGAHFAPKSPRSAANSARSQQSSRLASTSSVALAVEGMPAPTHSRSQLTPRSATKSSRSQQSSSLASASRMAVAEDSTTAGEAGDRTPVTASSRKVTAGAEQSIAGDGSTPMPATAAAQSMDEAPEQETTSPPAYHQSAAEDSSQHLQHLEMGERHASPTCMSEDSLQNSIDLEGAGTEALAGESEAQDGHHN